MKRTLNTVILSCIGIIASAQSIGIGTTTPDPRTNLDRFTLTGALKGSAADPAVAEARDKGRKRGKGTP